LTETALEKVTILTCDGKVFVGELKGFDSMMNIVVSKAQERIFSAEEGVEVVDLGLYLLRGDSVAVVGLLDQEGDEMVNLEAVLAEPMAPIHV